MKEKFNFFKLAKDILQKSSVFFLSQPLSLFIFNFVCRKHRKEQPLFVFGTWRGGTTLLQRLLNSVKGVAVWGEQGDFLKEVASAYFTTLEKKVSRVQLRQDERSYACYSQKTIKDPKVWVGWTNWYGIERYRDNFRRFVKSFYAPVFFGARHWGFKEIRYGSGDRVLEFLIDLFPQARFVFITREPVGAISSQLAMMKTKPIGTEKEKFLNLRTGIWNAQNKNYLDFCKQYEENTRLIRYEDLVSENSNELNSLFNFLGFKLSMKQKNIFGLSEGRLSTPPELKAGILSSEETDRIKYKTQDIRKLLGYL